MALDALDPLQKPPYYLAPKAFRPEVLVDEKRILLIDPDGFYLGFAGPWGAGGELGRLVMANRTPSSRGF